MRLLRHYPAHNYKSIWHRTADIDLAGITVVFGPNGAGKTNLLEAIAFMFEDAASEYFTQPRPRPGGKADEEALPAPVYLQFDCSDQHGSVEQQIVWKLLTHEQMTLILGFGGSSWKRVRSTARVELERLFEKSPSSCNSVDELTHVIQLWAQALAEADGTGSFEDRFDLALALLEQRCFSFPEGEPIIVAGDLPAEAFESAARIAEDDYRVPENTPFADQLFSTAQVIAGRQLGDDPFPVAFPAGEPDLGRKIAEVRELLGGVWLVDGDSTTLAEDVAEAIPDIDIAALQDRANSFAPAFVADAGTIELDSTPGGQVLGFRERDGEKRLVTDLGAGIARWVAIAVRAAMREAGDPNPLRLWLLDEPEEHLHLNAIRDLRNWLTERNQEGVGIVVATHALELLDLPASHAEFLLLARDEDGGSVAVGASGLIESLEAYASDLGINPSDAIRLARAFLIVEGKHDEQIIRRFYGDRLAQHRMPLLSLHGVHETLALVELEYLCRLGVPLVYLCDNLSDEFLKRPRLEAGASSEEQKLFMFFAAKRRDPSVEIHVRSHGLPDIIFALPEDAVRAVVGAGFRGWQPLRNIYAGHDPKSRLASELGVPAVNGRFIEAVLDAGPPDIRPADALETAMQCVFALVELT